jgi:hypothetical protein
VDGTLSDTGRCINCGFLAKRVLLDQRRRAITPSYHEVGWDGREEGYVWECVQDPFVGPVGAEPFCFTHAADLIPEIGSARGELGNELKAAQKVFAKDRHCNSWYRYNPGLSPKEHFEQMNMELLERSRREFEERLEKDRKEFDLKLFETSQRIQDDSRKIAQWSFKSNLF